MKEAVVETRKRLKVARKIKKLIGPLVEGIVIGGSVGFGQNYSVTKNSDIDMPVIIDPKDVEELTKTIYLKGCDRQAIQLFTRGKIDFFWVTKQIDGVIANMFIYNQASYENFCTLKSSIKGFRRILPDSERKSMTRYGFDGKPIEVDKNLRKTRNGWVFEHPQFHNGKYFGIMSRGDLLGLGYAFYERERNYFKHLSSRTWESVINQLVKEHGMKTKEGVSVDLTRFNVLNTLWVVHHNPTKVPQEVLQKIEKRTREELRKIIGH